MSENQHGVHGCNELLPAAVLARGEPFGVVTVRAGDMSALVGTRGLWLDSSDGACHWAIEASDEYAND